MKIGDILGNVNAISNRHETQSVYNYWHLYSETLIAGGGGGGGGGDS